MMGEYDRFGVETGSFIGGCFVVLSFCRFVADCGRLGSRRYRGGRAAAAAQAAAQNVFRGQQTQGVSPADPKTLKP